MIWFCFVLSTVSGLLQSSEYITWLFEENDVEESYGSSYPLCFYGKLDWSVSTV